VRAGLTGTLDLRLYFGPSGFEWRIRSEICGNDILVGFEFDDGPQTICRHNFIMDHNIPVVEIGDRTKMISKMRRPPKLADNFGTPDLIFMYF